LDDAQVAGDLVALRVDVAVTGEGGVKIAEVLEALFGASDAVPWHAVRAEMGLWCDGALVSPLALEAHRVPPPVLAEVSTLQTM
ncbi:MAG TPA: hypothetical protein VIF62_21710, partial [Labilithrix sp.]